MRRSEERRQAQDQLMARYRELERELDRVTAQRNELRRVLGDVRRYAREEASRVTTEAVHAMTKTIREQERLDLAEVTREVRRELIRQEQTGSGRRYPPPARSDKIGSPTPSGPVHLAAHLQDPDDPRHTGDRS